MIKVFVSGCFDILHAGHIHFLEDAKLLGDHLTVCFASNEVLMLAKKRKPSIPEDNKMVILKALRCVDDVVMSSNLDPVFDFTDHIERIKPDIVAVTEDDIHAEEKKKFLDKYNIKLVVLPKRNCHTVTSTSGIIKNIKSIF